MSPSSFPISFFLFKEAASGQYVFGTDDADVTDCRGRIDASPAFIHVPARSDESRALSFSDEAQFDVHDLRPVSQTDGRTPGAEAA